MGPSYLGQANDELDYAFNKHCADLVSVLSQPRGNCGGTSVPLDDLVAGSTR